MSMGQELPLGPLRCKSYPLLRLPVHTSHDEHGLAVSLFIALRLVEDDALSSQEPQRG
jgi:hypothetical protein